MSRAPAVAALAFTLCLLAAAFGTPALYVPGIAFALLAVAAETSVRLSASGVQVLREPLEATVEEGTPLRLLATVRGRRLSLRGGEVSSGAGADFTPRRWLTRDRLKFTVTPQRRGSYELAPSALRLRDPFGICVRTVSSPATELLVLPRVDRGAHAALARIAHGAVGAPRRGAGASIELDGLRPYQQRGPAARIHWPTAARTGELMEHRVVAERDAVPLLVLDARACAGDTALDMAVRATASLALALARSGGCSVLLPGDHRPQRLEADLAGWPALHRRLALLEPRRAVFSAATERAPLVLWVTARAVPLDGSQSVPGADYLVSPFPDRGAVVAEIAGCGVQALRPARGRRSA
jgi:uncharacterized protein (DUF58 family)